MAITINSNIAALRSIDSLDRASHAQNTALERLSSGLRINSASDDAAGAAVAAMLGAKARINTQGIRNINDGISSLNIADGATGELKNILFRLKELATQSANGSLSNTQRQSLDKESKALQSEYNRIIATTTFNETSVFNSGALSIQAGYGNDSILSVRLSKDVKVADGTFSAATQFSTQAGTAAVGAADLNGDGKMDLISVDQVDALTVQLGNGDGTFSWRWTVNVGPDPESITIADLNNDGIIRANFIGA